MGSEVFAVLGSLGGIVAFIGAVIIIARGIFGMVNATKENTEMLHVLNQTCQELRSELHRQAERIARLEGRDFPSRSQSLQP